MTLDELKADEWKTADDYYRLYNELRDWMEGVRQAVYETGDIESLENCLEECFHLVDVRMPIERPKLAKDEQS